MIRACDYCGSPLNRWQRVWHEARWISYSGSCAAVLAGRRAELLQQAVTLLGAAEAWADDLVVQLRQMLADDADRPSA